MDSAEIALANVEKHHLKYCRQKAFPGKNILELIPGYLIVKANFTGDSLVATTKKKLCWSIKTVDEIRVMSNK